MLKRKVDNDCTRGHKELVELPCEYLFVDTTLIFYLVKDPHCYQHFFAKSCPSIKWFMEIVNMLHTY